MRFKLEEGVRTGELLTETGQLQGEKGEGRGVDSIYGTENIKIKKREKESS